MSRRRGLGSGLDALIPSGAGQPSAGVRQIPVDAIRENRSQPRTRFDEQALEELAASIREHGLIQPIIVSEDPDGGYELIAGERRWRAARRAGLGQVPALVKAATPQQLLELALVENVQRADLNALEEGRAYQTLKDEFGLTDELIAQRVGKSRVAVVNTRRLIRLTAAAQQALLDGTISAGHGRALLRFEGADEQNAALELIARRDLSVREAERLGEVAHHAGLAPAARAALLSGALSLAHAQALLRVDDAALQGEAVGRVLGLGLSTRETEQVADLLAEGAPLEGAIGQVRGAAQGAPHKAAPGRHAERPEPDGAPRGLSPDDAEVQRMFEAVLETPVQLSRSGRVIRLTITCFDDEQLQGLYERLAGRQGE
ncbi:MAG TPA: ParB/RepB/Spo0J family partition protein [Chloroflexaceae bacterium]|nr:ParB/RepB/Spo0J family partition protein [Chloroflexaceae bacterium]